MTSARECAHIILTTDDAGLPLSEPFKQIIILSETDRYQDIAAKLDIPLGTVRSRLHRARKALLKERNLREANARTPLEINSLTVTA